MNFLESKPRVIVLFGEDILFRSLEKGDLASTNFNDVLNYLKDRGIILYVLSTHAVELPKIGYHDELIRSISIGSADDQFGAIGYIVKKARSQKIDPSRIFVFGNKRAERRAAENNHTQFARVSSPSSVVNQLARYFGKRILETRPEAKNEPLEVDEKDSQAREPSKPAGVRRHHPDLPKPKPPEKKKQGRLRAALRKLKEKIRSK